MIAITLTIDGKPVERRRGRDDPRRAATRAGVETPTLCFLETLTPVNACRVCVVELEGARALVPACARKAEAGHEGAHRLRARAAQPQDGARVSGVVGRSVDGARTRSDTASGTAPSRRATAPHARDRRAAGEGRQRPLRARLLEVHLCYKCVEACGTDAQNTFAIAAAGRGFDAHISTEYDVPLPDSACVYCGNCIGVCPTGALMFSSRARDARGRHVGRIASRRRPIRSAPYCGVGCTLTLHVQENEIVKVTSPIENSVTQRQPLHQGPLRQQSTCRIARTRTPP